MMIRVATLLSAVIVASCASAPAPATTTLTPSASSSLSTGATAPPTASPAPRPSTTPAPTAPPTASPAPVPAPVFTISAEITVGAGNAVPAAADLDGDGDIDVALPGAGVSIFLNDGNGNFAAPVKLDVGAERLVATDFTGDGKVDLALAADDNLAVYTGKGDGTFQQPPDFYPAANDLPIIGNIEGIDAGDLDGDGDPDITIAYFGAAGADVTAPGHLAVFINNGATGFEQAVYYGCDACTAVVMDDFDEDGATDAVGAQFNNVARFWRGPGDGTLARGTPFNTGGRSAAIVAEDVNGDGHLDLFIGNNHDFTISVLLGDGDGTFGAPLVMTAGNTHYIAIADLDADGDQDLLSGNDTFLHAWLGDGSGNFAATEGIHLNDPDARGAAVADFNADGLPDLAVSSGESTLVILFGGAN